MKVLKFGGSSVGSHEGLANLKKIVEGQSCPCIVVVSALGGVTDLLLNTAREATAGDPAYHDGLDRLYSRHHDLIRSIISDRPEELIEEIDTLLSEIASIYHGLSLIKDISEKTIALIVSYGERLSSRIVARLITGSELHDSRNFIKTDNKHNRMMLASDLTNSLVRDEFGQDVKGIHIVPGFISTDANTGEVTNLGRGGSDYTASIIAAALDADVLEIWTDVDGFMTADPRVIDNAYVIDELT
ncbi:MAG: bifunctional aspartate kinase/homoserine dehydrogenase I, partial [Muribaculaceae bacterium]|nr:bifunctional aspartate kinase/homoserine dehydrogenase I [Muribaculaceae bacterium]